MIPDLIAILGSWISCWPMSTDEETNTHADGGRATGDRGESWRTIPPSEAVCIDALKIVQRHRGWVSDESLARHCANCSACRPPISMAWPRSTT